LKAKIFSFEILIRTTGLTIGDEAMGCLYGEFVPVEDYYRNTQSIVWRLTSYQNLNMANLGNIEVEC